MTLRANTDHAAPFQTPGQIGRVFLDLPAGDAEHPVFFNQARVRPIVEIALLKEVRKMASVLFSPIALRDLARGAMWDPRWAWHAAEELGAERRMRRR